ncbi:hypothetical protein SPBR_05312 [Sporothrix brasiliensis 5110]|uniref:Uncharacterized protein n=1 Tax=Sporothrix brasiliensis 5110 TaxID=1398154 RepID=A0A0C2IL51_9PEZI|nr:uncharacterized protein SPBR_05312 [Sporothrix brasiliensis 5110]KIH87710.1 hypothetical protein SPBR_05312 [Sporothrix brasiliensis 5110]
MSDARKELKRGDETRRRLPQDIQTLELVWAGVAGRTGIWLRPAAAVGRFADGVVGFGKWDDVEDGEDGELGQAVGRRSVEEFAVRLRRKTAQG